MITIQSDAAPSHPKPLTPFRRLGGVLALLLLPLLSGTALGQMVIAIPDANLEAAVRSALGRPNGDLTSDDMLSLQMLGAAGRGINNLAGLEWALNLAYLDLGNNAIADASPLSALTNLQSLVLNDNHLTAGAPLAGLVHLQVLLLDNNSINDSNWLGGLTELRVLSMLFNPLGNADAVGRLTSLTELHLNGTGISDIGFVQNLRNLTILGLGDNNIQDGSPIAGLTQLEFLGMGANPVRNWDFISGLTSLRTLYLFSDSLQDISFLAGLRNLVWLRLSGNQISSAAPLAGLNNLQYLDLSWNQLTSSQPLTSLTALTNLDLSWNNLPEVSGLGAQRSLQELNLANNQVADASSLGGLTSLQNLDLNHNRLGTLDFAQGLTHLRSLDASDNRLMDIRGLLGAVSLVSVNLNNNLLLLTPGSPARNVISALQSRGATVNSDSQGVAYEPTAGTYYGLFYAETGLSCNNSGSITLTTTGLRHYTGKLQLGKTSYSFLGTLGQDGTGSQLLQKGKQLPVRLNLVMEGADFLTGSVTVGGQTTAADLLGYRAGFSSRTNLAPQAGRYTLSVAGSNTLALPGGSNSVSLPAGSGYGTLTVNSAGQLKCAGALADGTRFSQSGWVTANGQCPLYTQLYSGKGALLGWLGLTNGPTFGGNLAWIKPSAKAKYYPTGFGWITTVAGSRYAAPAKGNNVFNLTNCNLSLSLTGGGLKGGLVSQFTLNAKNQVKALPMGSKLSLRFTPSTGVFQGRTVDPDTHKGVSFSGVILQNQTNGCGFFLGSSTSGGVLLSQ